MDGKANVPATAARRPRAAWYAAVIFATFLAGFVPMWWTARTRANERDVAQRALRLSEIENTLAAATIQARRGDYEPAREEASKFYTAVMTELDRAGSGFAETQRGALQALLADRDQMITLLARSDPAVAERLSNTYVSYRQAVGTLAGQAEPPGGAR
jgi:hypothetical protein